MFLLSAALALSMQTAATAPSTVHLLVPSGHKCRLLVEGVEASEAEFRRMARRWHAYQPEVHFNVDPDARYACVDRALTLVKRADLNRLGFIGNEQLTETPLKLEIRLNGDSCDSLIEGVSLASMEGQTVIAEAARTEKFIAITGMHDAPYRCIGGLIFEMQKAGYVVNFTPEAAAEGALVYAIPQSRAGGRKIGFIGKEQYEEDAK